MVWRGGVRHHWDTIGGSRIHWVEAGDPAAFPVLCINGWMGSWESFAGMVSYLDVHLRLILLDIPGFGESEPLPASHTVVEVSRFIKSFVDSIGLSRFHLIGLSFGGAVAIHFAATYPLLVEKLVVQGAPFYGKLFKPWIRWGARILTFPFMIYFAGLIFRRKWLTYRILRSRKYLSLLTDEEILQKAYRTANASGRAAMESARDVTRLDLRGCARQIKAETFIIDGADVRFKPLATWNFLHSFIPNSRLFLIRDAGHTVAVQKATEFSKQVFRFLSSD